MNRGFDTPLINRIIFGQTRLLMGGKVRLILSGGAPLAPDTHEFIKTCLCVQVLQGYGLTESCSSATVMDGKSSSCVSLKVFFVLRIQKFFSCSSR